MMLAFTADLPVRVLAVVGAFAAGALIAGGGTQLFCKVMFNQKLPRYPLWALRLMGGVVCGWLVMLWLFGGGGGGIGGPGGYGGGSGSWSENDKDHSASKKSEGKKGEKADDSPPAVGETLTVEILGDEPLRKAAKAEPGKRYRVTGVTGLMSLDEVKKLIRERRDASPPLGRLEVVLYLDSPDQFGAQVTSLTGWANDLEVKGKKWLRVDYAMRDRYAPMQ